MANSYPIRMTTTYKGIRIDKRGNTEAEVGAKIQKAMDEIDAGMQLHSGGTLVSKWFEEYIRNYVDGTVNYQTQKDRESSFKRNIQPYIGSMRIRDVKVADCQNVINNMSGHSKDYIDKTCQLLYNIFHKARINKMISDNPAEDLSRPQADNGHGRPVTLQEHALMLLVADDGHKAGLWIKCMLYLGMRPGETSRFKGSHINYEEQLIFIDGTKSKAAKRIVPAPEFLINELASHDFGPDDYVFTNAYGDKMQKSSRQNLWHSLMRDMNIKAGCKLYRNAVEDPVLPEDFIPYCCRHYYATCLKDANVPFRIRQELLGHANSSVTDRYTHRTETSLKIARELLKKNQAAEYERIKEEQERLLTDGWDSENASEDLLSKFFPGI